jgi:hypothetical protein
MPLGSAIRTQVKRATATATMPAWRDSAVAACLAFVGLVAVGAVLVAAAKLQFTSLGTGSNPLRVLSATVMAGLASIGATVRIGELSLAVVPLGALVAAGFLMSWAVTVTFDESAVGRGSRETAAAAVRFGVVLGLLCFGAALIFRIPEDPVPVSVSAVQAGLFGLVWGSACGGLGLAMRGLSWRDQLRRSWVELMKPGGVWRGAFAGSVVGLGTLLVTSLAAVLIGTIYRLAVSPLPGRFDVGDAIAGFVYLIVFLPNALVSVASLAMGAPIVVGAEITAGGERVGPVLEYSLASWGDGSSPPIVYLLLLVPLVSFLAAGFTVRAVTADRDGTLLSIVLGAAVTAPVVGLLCVASDARLGAGLAGGNGVAKVAPDAVAVMPLAFGWSLAVGLAGWALHDLLERRKAHGSRNI